MTQEEISFEQWYALEASDYAAPEPRLDHGKEESEPVRGELVMDEGFTIAARPEDVPAVS
jgi:hypothetical protein